MSAAITEPVALVCLDCHRTFHVPPRPGVYPLRCEECRGYVAVTCVDCGTVWRMRDYRTPKSRPKRCASCQRSKAHADLVVRIGRGHGLDTRAVFVDGRWVVHATGAHSRPVRLDDEVDVEFLWAEVAS